jgi:hypothetical protein
MNRETIRARLPLDAAALLLRLWGKTVGMAHITISSEPDYSHTECLL